jgi:HPt (histidine-containing phosphotransfer) domain-containing protein
LIYHKQEKLTFLLFFYEIFRPLQMSSPGKREQIKDHLQNQFGLSTEQIEDLLPLFLKTLHGYLDDLEAAAADDDLEQLGKKAHTAKGALLNLGLEISAERARVIELLARTGNESTDYQARAAELRAGLADYFD